ncbi:MAG: leucine-rich repeat domain-containing protein [Muribaculaceae bacterium]|nr:leucine-rich repeat domain-containing protein [Muribaculaceae bacterium]
MTFTKNSKNVPAYTGDIKLPDNPVVHEGKEYIIVGMTATAVGKNANVTSVYLPDGCVALPRGSFMNTTGLKSVRLPEDLETIQGDLFNGSGIEEIVIPGKVKAFGSNMFINCASLKKITIAEGETPINYPVNTSIKVSGKEGEYSPLEEVVLLRDITGLEKPAEVPFRGSKTLTKLTVGGKCTQINTYYFENCSALADVTIGESVTTIAGNAFAGTAITEIALPAGVTSVSASSFQNCRQLKKVTLGDKVTTIGDMAFYNAPVESINLPATLTTIGAYAFSGSNLSGDLVIPAEVTSIGTEAFRGNKKLTSITLGANVTKIGDAAFRGCTGLKSIAIDEANSAYQVKDNTLLTKDGSTILLYAAASEPTSYSNATATAVGAYAFMGATNLTEINLPAVTTWGDYALSNTGLKSYQLGGTVGRYVLQGCKSLESFKLLDGAEIPFGIVKGCTAITKFETTQNPTILKQEAFSGATSLKKVDLGPIMSIIEADAFANCGVEEIVVSATHPAALAEGVFTPAMSAIKVSVPVSAVDAYKAADQWKNLTIAGDANLAAGGADMGMPDGLYYAGEDGDIHCVYSDGQTDDYSVGGVPHTFQLLEYKNRIYGSSAGKKFVYSGTSGTEGDGKLFYISRVDGNIFQAVVFDNAGANAYADPFNLYIYGEDLYVNDRNVGIRKVPAGAIALPTTYPNWLENNWLGYYNDPWTYGCIKCGFAITKDQDADGNPEPLYWLGMKYNGFGIFRFKESDIVIPHKDEEGKDVNPKKPSYATILGNYSPIITTFNIDEANDAFYVYIEKGGASNKDSQAEEPSVSGPEAEGSLIKGGLYRAKLSELIANPNPNPQDHSQFTNLFTLIDGAPVRWEGSSTNEHVGISQLAFDADHKYMYWCYRAPTEAQIEQASTFSGQKSGHYVWAEAYDASNPLHHSGIKRLKLDDPEAKVEMVVPGVEGYGVVPVNYEGSTKDSGVTLIVADKQATDRVIVSGDSFTLTEEGLVKVYALNGTLISEMNVAAGENTSLNGNATGVYVIEALFADGAKQIVKIAIR